MSYSTILRGIVLVSAVFGSAAAQPVPDGAATVGVGNFVRAESDLYMAKMAADGSFGKFVHDRQPVAIEAQKIIRMNRDTLYSGAVFDLDAAPVTITVPRAGKRFVSMQVVSQDHYVPAVYYGAGRHTLTRQSVGTRYAFVAIRILADPADPKDLQQVHALQDAIQVSQARAGTFEVPNWDQKSQKTVRDALLVLGATLPNYDRAFGARGAVDPIDHLIGAAVGWGGNPAKDATYLGGAVPTNDGKSIYRLEVGPVPVKGFWSVSVYNAQGYFEKNPYDAYSLNNLTSRRNADGKIIIQFGGCDGKIPNCLPTTPGWNYTVRLYQPGEEILNGSWRFPEPRLVAR
ncbi:DUF1254 domain-containing protein [Bordetella pseudohinzii]|uniref:Protein of uncharacterized function (DUF1214) n=1 Tax=Bordetella pseudohinzii TaxID=1331258 RepID=A0A0J6C8P2_9BORD|nr:DUF1254 domain-containing protein [Bordetella pseudohinzii]ANY17520.1 hypothetical protein BBN53_17535 [Bordetella pseudohinzii]KMM25747.1 hypothetical protein L540_19125 [Bordetella pseudohinzii]KXA81737.1 hypothetical protein AW878_03935 [Bordetella pseudohinzii]KXA83024.1 hypothetical protein AW877_00420 [Bordetella pseudohinzii]CUI73062.1 Protein of uncharacterised function (DUF1214) [Bordetella pseudohinzii]